MNRKAYISIFAFALVCLAAGFLTSCSSSSSTTTTPPAITVALSTAPPTSLNTFQTASVAATVANDSANAGVTWSCAPAGSCGTFSASASASGASVTYTAPSAATSVTITATSVTNTSVSASGSVTVAQATTSNYVFYASGQEVPNANNGDVQDYYAVAGVVQLDSNGNIYGGEQDYNDAFGVTATDTYSAEPGALVVDPTTGVGTLTLTTSDALVGVSGVETFAIQFANADHALVSQFDGTATSSGSFDLQNLSVGTSGSSAFAMSGVDPSYASVGFGGIFAPTSSTSATVTLDANDDGATSFANSYTATLGTPDAFGRTVITGISNPVSATTMTIAAYPVTQEAIRLIDIDAADSAVGSAYGQGSAAGNYTDASMPAAFTFDSIGQWSEQYATLGALTSDGVGDITGQGDDNELDNGIQEFPDTIVSGSAYNVASNGYGWMGLAWNVGNEDATYWGVYMVDPALDINDPNNINSSPDVGGAVIVDMNALPGGMGVITPQTDTTQADFAGNYAAGFQNFNFFQTANECTEPCTQFELDMVGPFSMTATTGPLSTATIGADDSDPFGTWDGTPAESTGDTFTSTPLWVSAGFYSMSALNSPANPIEATINVAVTGGPGTLDVDMYQASGFTLYWIESIDINGVYLGSLQVQPSAGLTGVPGLKRPGKTPAKLNKNAKPIKGLGGQVR
jgi:hypothetical protein